MRPECRPEMSPDRSQCLWRLKIYLAQNQCQTSTFKWSTGNHLFAHTWVPFSIRVLAHMVCPMFQWCISIDSVKYELSACNWHFLFLFFWASRLFTKNFYRFVFLVWVVRIQHFTALDMKLEILIIFTVSHIEWFTLHLLPINLGFFSLN